MITNFLVDMNKKAGRPRADMTEKEEQIMHFLWNKGPLFVREIVELYDDPKPHFNTVATTVRILEQKGHVEHEVVNGSHRFRAVTRMEKVRDGKLRSFIRHYFSDNYLAAVSTLVSEDKISIDQLKELIDMVEHPDRDK